MTTNRIRFEAGEYGPRAVIVGIWSNDMVKPLLDGHVVELELNDGKGWRGSDVKFLAELRQLQALKIIDFKIASVEPIHQLAQLRALEVMTYCKSDIEFSAFPLLEDCGLEWRPGAASLFDLRTLKKLFINNYDGKNTDSFSNLINLETLAILTAPLEQICGLSVLRKLRSLRLGNLRRLTSLAGIEQLTNLEDLDINTCRHIRSIDEIGFLHQLRRLHLDNDGPITSLKPLGELRGLELITFYESTTIVDGDLSPLLSQKNLARVSFQNRRHYSHRRENFGPNNKA